MPLNLTRKLIHDHLARGTPEKGQEIGITIDQTLTQDATGTLVMLELEAMGLERVQTELSVQYVDHNLLQLDHRNPDDHDFLRSACARFGVHYSRAGNGVSHPLHQHHFGIPGKSLLGSDSHTPAAGSMGMLAMGAGGLEVALAMAGQPYFLPMPGVWRIVLEGQLPQWVSAKDVILELLRRHDVKGATGYVLEYSGPGVESLSAMDRHVVANMGAELGATTSVFPSDGVTREFLRTQGREDDWRELRADEGARYEREEVIDLSTLEPLIARPSSPGNVVPVTEVAGQPIQQAYIGSSANPGFRDFAVVAEIVEGHRIPASVSLDINPSTREVLGQLTATGHLESLVAAGARIHQPGCNGCIGMGQAPSTGGISLRTVPRNFPGRSGTLDDRVYLVSPETAAASALRGEITDPRTLGRPPRSALRAPVASRASDLFELPLPPEEASRVELIRGPNILPLPSLDTLPARLELVCELKLGDNVSTDEILPAGSRILPLRSNIPAIRRHCFEAVDPDYATRALESQKGGGHLIVAGENYGQGSSREHAALAPRHLGLRAVIAKSFARIHRQNLVNYGVLPLTFENPDDLGKIEAGQRFTIPDPGDRLARGQGLEVIPGEGGSPISVSHELSERQVEILLAGGLIEKVRQKVQS